MAADRISGDWLDLPATRAVIEALETARPESARFVGGCVRNTLMERPVDDIDIATQLEPLDVIGALETAGIKAVPTGIEHGTVTAVSEGRPFEITTLRRDVETDGRRAVVAFSESWEEDAARRDFRLNALYAEPDGTLHDPTGGGLLDARAGRVIFIGDADQRLREDYLRILRFFRFNAWYGARIDPGGLEACRRRQYGLGQIASERIWKEFGKLLAAPDPGEVAAAMYETGVLQVLLGEDFGGADGVAKLVDAELDYGLRAEPVRRLMTLVPRSEVAVDVLVARLRLSNAERDRLLAWINPDLLVLGETDASAIRAGIYRFGAEAVLDRTLVDHAGSDGEFTEDFLHLAETWTPPKFPLGGEDAKAAGLEGPAIGEALRVVEDWWVERDFTPERETLLVRLNMAVGD